MEMIELESVGPTGTVRFNLNHLVGYNENELWLLGERLDLMPGTAAALDKVLKERSGIAFLRVVPVENTVETHKPPMDFIESLREAVKKQ